MRFPAIDKGHDFFAKPWALSTSPAHHTRGNSKYLNNEVAHLTPQSGLRHTVTSLAYWQVMAPLRANKAGFVG